ncbi:Callose synthase 9 [Glycine soja]
MEKMSRAEEHWERLVRAALRRERTGDDAYGRPVGGIAGNVPSALAKNRDIDEILRVADEIEDDDPNISRILCEHAYSLSQNLDPNSEGRGVLQFKTGLMSVIKQKLTKREAGTIDRSQDIARLQEFYKSYREKHNVDKLCEEEMKLRESGAFSRDLGEMKLILLQSPNKTIQVRIYLLRCPIATTSVRLERKTLKRKRVFATLKVLGTVLEQLCEEEIPDELKRLMDSDSALTEDLIAYNIIPLDASSSTNAIVYFPEVQAAVSALKYFNGLPELPRGYFIQPTRNATMFDFLQCTFGFQKDNVANQHEHIVHLLANEQSRLRIPEDAEPKLDEAAVQAIFLKSLQNYINWCDYLGIQPVWSSLEAVSKEKKLLYVSLYFLIWGEASNIRFLPECLCYIFHHMAREMDEILRQQIAQPANSCIYDSKDGVSFLDNVIFPLYDIVSAEAANNDNGKAPHSSWRNYDDFNDWPWRKSSPFFQKPQPRSKKMLIPGSSRHQGKTSFVEHRTFFHLYHSFHRLWIFLFMMFQGLTILAFNNGKLNAKTLREVLSLGPTFVVMKFFESVLDIFMMYGAYSTTRRSAVSRIFLRFLWFSLASVFITFLYVKALQEESNINGNSVVFRLYVIVIGIYAGVQFFISFLMRIPACHRLTNQCDRFPLISFVKWLRQVFISSVALVVANFVCSVYCGIMPTDGFAFIERHYVGRGMYERSSDFIKYMLFWLVILSAKFAFAYFLQIRPLVDPTRAIIKEDNINYSWHDFVSKNIYVFYTLVSAVYGFLLGARDRLGEVVEKNKVDAARFAPFWNEIIRNLREEDYVTNFEMELLLMPKNSGDLPLVQWPLFLLASKIFLARDIAVESKDTQDEPWDRISRDDYMMYAVQECYYAIKFILTEILDDVGRKWVERIYDDINASITKRSIHVDFQLNKLALVITRVTALMVRGMMYYRKALMLQTYLERTTAGGCEEVTDTHGFELSPEARAQADLKFTYVLTCQIYGKQKEEQKPEAADIALLMQRNEALRVAFIDVVETLKEGKVNTEYYSKLVKADINGKDKEIYSVKLPGNPKLGEGKPENQNHAIVFTRGNAVQTIDMNQDNYFEEALKMRNLLEEFHSDHGLRPPSILGVREHVFTGSVSSLASFMSNQETSFVTLGQRVLANPLKVRMHYGHPDVFDRIFHVTRGGISKASRVINISEDIYSGFNSTLRQGNITHHEYIQVGKGRDVGLNQIALFEGKVSGGNGEQVLSRDVYRLGQLFDFFRMLSFYFTTVGYYFCTMLTVLTVYAFLYGKAYLALSGVGETIEERARITKNTALSAALNTQFLFQIGIFTAVPMILGFILEQGFLRAIVSFVTMQFQLCTVFFTFSLGTRTHYFGRTILHGGARYQATGRGFVVRHIKFSENYRLYSRSHFVKGLEVALLLIVYLAYGSNEGGALSYILLSISSWFMALSWLFAPYLFNPSGFEWQKVVEDFRDWTNWLLYRGGIGVKGEESWEAWWEEELAHIRSLGSRIAETILSLRFFIFQYGIVYKLNVKGTSTSLTVYGLSWVVLAVLIILFKVFTFSQKISVNFQLLLRFIQGVSLLVALAGLVVAVILTKLSLPDIFASMLAFIPTGWGILSIAAAWKPVMKRLGLWKSVRSIARLYDAGMGMLIFVPIAFFSWFPFVSTFQTRLMFNQAFSRGWEQSQYWDIVALFLNEIQSMVSFKFCGGESN